MFDLLDRVLATRALSRPDRPSALRGLAPAQGASVPSSRARTTAPICIEPPRAVQAPVEREISMTDLVGYHNFSEAMEKAISYVVEEDRISGCNGERPCDATTAWERFGIVFERSFPDLFGPGAVQDTASAIERRALRADIEKTVRPYLESWRADASARRQSSGG